MLTPEQLEARRKGIGGSDVAAICGLSPFKTPLHVYFEKLGMDLGESIGNENRVIWGNELERVIAHYYMRKNNIWLIRDPSFLHFSKKVQNVELLANCDGGILKRDPYAALGAMDATGIDLKDLLEPENLENPLESLIEIKTTDKENAWKWGEEGTDQMPDEYKFQCAHYSLVTGIPIVHVAVLIGGNDYREYVYQRNEVFEGLILERCIHFWKEYVEKKVPPPATCEEDCRLLYQTSSATKAIATPEIESKMLELRSLNKLIADLEKKKEVYKMEVMDFMKDADTLITDQEKLLATWKSSKPIVRFDITSFKEDCPDLYPDYCKEGKSTRTFLIK